MPDLNDLRIEASIEDYDGTEGPNSEEDMSYFANEIPSYAFQNNHNLKKITFSNANYLSVGDYAFDGCNSLTNFNAMLKGQIGDFAFRNTNLKSIEICSYVNRIGRYAFLNCTNLQSVYIDNIRSWCDIKFDGTYEKSPHSNPLYYAHHIYSSDE